MNLSDHGSVAYLSRWKSFISWFRMVAPKDNQITASLLFAGTLLIQVWFAQMELDVVLKWMAAVLGLTIVALVYKKRRLLKHFDRTLDDGLRLVVRRPSAGSIRYSYYILNNGEMLELSEEGRAMARKPQPTTEFGLSPRGNVRTLTMDEETWLARIP